VRDLADRLRRRARAHVRARMTQTRSTRWRARSTARAETAYGGPARRTAHGLACSPPLADPGRRRRPHEPLLRRGPGWSATLPAVTAWRPAMPSCPTTIAWAQRDRLLLTAARRRGRAAGCPRRRHVIARRLRPRADVGRPRAGRARDPRCPRLSARPLLLVDVDGVLSLFGPGVDRAACTPRSSRASRTALPPRRTLLARLARATTASGARAGRTAPTATSRTCSAARGLAAHRFATARRTRATGSCARSTPMRPGPPAARGSTTRHDERCHTWARSAPARRCSSPTDPQPGLTEATPISSRRGYAASHGAPQHRPRRDQDRRRRAVAAGGCRGRSHTRSPPSRHHARRTGQTPRAPPITAQAQPEPRATAVGGCPLGHWLGAGTTRVAGRTRSGRHAS
jgi:hypothetical protein